MNRTMKPNPDFDGRQIGRGTFNAQAERLDWEKAIAVSPPAGTRNYIRWVGGELEWGMEKIPAGPGVAVVSEDDGLDKMSEADIKTICGKIQVKYTDKSIKSDLIASIRAKRGGK